MSNHVAKQAVKAACLAYQNFFKGQAKKPRFKSRKRSNPSFYHDNMKLKVKEKTVLIEKVGWMKTSESIPVGVKYTNPRISYDGKYGDLSVGVEQSAEDIELIKVSLGIDVGIKDLAIFLDGKVFRNINQTKVVRQLEKRLKRLQRQVSRKYELNKKGGTFAKTNKMMKHEKEIRLVHRRLKNIRLNHHHQATNQIVKTKPSRIVMETLKA